MTDFAVADGYGVLTEPATLTVTRLLPGPIERVWAYLTESDLRRQWLAAGEMEPRVGAAFELTWRNDELTDPPGTRPPGASAEHSMQSRVIAFEPPTRLAITFGASGEVAFELAPSGTEVRLTVIHRRVPDRDTLLKVSPGWHMHLDVLEARLRDETPEPFWDGYGRLRADYERRLPA